jgi:hypothetical protein
VCVCARARARVCVCVCAQEGGRGAELSTPVEVEGRPQLLQIAQFPCARTRVCACACACVQGNSQLLKLAQFERRCLGLQFEVLGVVFKRRRGRRIHTRTLRRLGRQSCGWVVCVDAEGGQR